MEFGSKFVYNYSDSDEEVVSEDEYAEGLALDHREDVVAGAPIAGRALASSPPPPGALRSPPPPPGGGALRSPPPFSPARFGEGVLSSPHPIPMFGLQPPPPPPPASRSSRLGAYMAKAAKKVHHWQKRDRSRDRDQRSTNSADKTLKGKKVRRADTNILSLRFGDLTSASDMHTGDPFNCGSCGGVLSSLSKILAEDEENRMWWCEFCGQDNPVDLMEEEIPKKNDVTFMLKPAPCTTASGKSGIDESLVVFCVDVSGSMCVTTEVAGKVKLRGDHLDRLQSLNTERESQRMPGQRRDITYVSRLQGMQAAVDFQLLQMAKEHPDRKVALVAFNNEVTVIGDGSTSSVHFSGDKLSNLDEMQKAGVEYPAPGAIRATQKNIRDKLFDLEEGGQTALGPALLLSVALASQVSGSKVIICTDGMANIGLGSLDCGTDKALLDSASAFYQDVSQLACEKGVSVSVCTIQGTDCKLAELGQVAANTGGQVNIVDLLKLTQEFGNILAEATIATNVQATLVLHKGLYFRNEDEESNKITRDIGNVTKETEITFEYGVKHSHKRPKHAEGAAADQTEPPTEAASSSSNSCIDDLTELPFQLQLTYNDMEGAQALRVITQTKPITKDRSQAEKEMNAMVVGVHGAKQSAQMAMGGAYTESRLNAFAYDRVMYRNLASNDDVSDVYDQYLANVAPVERHLQQRQQVEMSSKGHTYSDSEEDDEDEMVETVEERRRGFLALKKGKAHKKAIKSRASEREDAPAEMLYHQAQSSAAKWKKG